MKNLFFLTIITATFSLASCGGGSRVSVDAVTEVIPLVDSNGITHVAAKILDNNQMYTVTIADPKVGNTLLVAQALGLLSKVRAEVWFDNSMFTKIETARIDMGKPKDFPNGPKK